MERKGAHTPECEMEIGSQMLNLLSHLAPLGALIMMELYGSTCKVWHAADAGPSLCQLPILPSCKPSQLFSCPGLFPLGF